MSVVRSLTCGRGVEEEEAGLGGWVPTAKFQPFTLLPRTAGRWWAPAGDGPPRAAAPAPRLPERVHDDGQQEVEQHQEDQDLKGPEEGGARHACASGGRGAASVEGSGRPPGRLDAARAHTHTPPTLQPAERLQVGVHSGLAQQQLEAGVDGAAQGGEACGVEAREGTPSLLTSEHVFFFFLSTGRLGASQQTPLSSGRDTQPTPSPARLPPSCQRQGRPAWRSPQTPGQTPGQSGASRALRAPASASPRPGAAAESAAGWAVGGRWV